MPPASVSSAPTRCNGSSAAPSGAASATTPRPATTSASALTAGGRSPARNVRPRFRRRRKIVRRLWADRDRRVQRELQPRLGGELQMLGALARHDGAGRGAGGQADRRAGAAAGDAADDARRDRRRAPTLRAVFLPSPEPFDST